MKLFIKRFLNGILRLVESKQEGIFSIMFSVLLDHPTTEDIWATVKISEDQFSREGLKMTSDMHETL